MLRIAAKAHQAREIIIKANMCPVLMPSAGVKRLEAAAKSALSRLGNPLGRAEQRPQHPGDDEHVAEKKRVEIGLVNGLSCKMERKHAAIKEVVKKMKHRVLLEARR